MADVQAPGVLATFHGTGGDFVGVEQRFRVLEAIDDRWVVAIPEGMSEQIAIPMRDGWWSDSEGRLPAVLPTAPPEG